MDVLVEILKKEYERRREKNPSFSMRSFSKHLDIDPSNLSKIMNYKKPIGKSTATKISEKLMKWGIDFSTQQSKNLFSETSKLFFINEGDYEKYYSFYVAESNKDVVHAAFQKLISSFDELRVDPKSNESAARVCFFIETKNEK